MDTSYLPMAGAAAEVTRTTQSIATALNPVTGPLHALVTGHRETSLELTRKLSQLANVHGTQLRVMLAVMTLQGMSGLTHGWTLHGITLAFQARGAHDECNSGNSVPGTTNCCPDWI